MRRQFSRFCAENEQGNLICTRVDAGVVVIILVNINGQYCIYSFS